MREIRFKAWDKINKRWIKLWELLFAITGELMGIDDIDGEIYGLHQFELIQYTGLLDKNGNEIYEGDIIRGFCTGNYPAVIECDAPNGGYNIRELSGDYIEIDSNTRLEVIGNIYLNPDLLNI